MLIDWPFRSVRFRVHPCFWLVVVPTVWSGYFLEVVTLFGLILIHELGHVSVARHFGWRMTEIELLPFGGVAKTDEWGTVPAKEEMLVAIAGPGPSMALWSFLELGAICSVGGIQSGLSFL